MSPPFTETFRPHANTFSLDGSWADASRCSGENAEARAPCEIVVNASISMEAKLPQNYKRRISLWPVWRNSGIDSSMTTTPPHEVRRQLAKYIFASNAFANANGIASVLHKMNPAQKSLDRHLYSVGIIQHYSQPFMKSYGLGEPLKPKGLIPMSHQKYHDSLWAMRNTVLTHRDVKNDVRDVDHWHANSVYIHIGKKEVTMSQNQVQIGQDHLQPIAELCQMLHDGIKAKLHFAFQSVFGTSGLPDGEYKMSVQEKPDLWLKKLS